MSAVVFWPLFFWIAVVDVLGRGLDFDLHPEHAADAVFEVGEQLGQFLLAELLQPLLEFLERLLELLDRLVLLLGRVVGCSS